MLPPRSEADDRQRPEKAIRTLNMGLQPLRGHGATRMLAA
jgi:hypothetical protein